VFNLVNSAAFAAVCRAAALLLLSTSASAVAPTTAGVAAAE